MPRVGSREIVHIAITEEAEALLGPILDKLATKVWTQDTPKPTCLVCEHVDFSGLLVEAHVLDKDEKHSVRMWLPHRFVVVAFDFAHLRKLGFHAKQ